MARTVAKDHDHKRRHILIVAAHVFARQGIARASMKEVAEAAGISKANIYHYYESKTALLFDILDNYLASLRDRVCTVSLDGKTPEAQLFLVVCEILLAYEGMDNEHKIQSEGLLVLDIAQQEILKDYQRDLVAFVGDILKQNAPEKFCHDMRHLRHVTMSVFGMVNWFYQWHPKANNKDRMDYAKTVTQLTLHGVKN